MYPVFTCGSRPPYQGAKGNAERSCFLQPVLIDLDLHHVRIGTAIVGPYVLLLEAHAIERLRRQAVAHLRQLFRIGKGAAQPLDLADMPANVERRADMAERRGLAHSDLLSHRKLGRHGRVLRRELRLHRLRFSTSCILRPSSSVVMTPRWISVCVSELIHFS